MHSFNGSNHPFQKSRLIFRLPQHFSHAANFHLVLTFISALVLWLSLRFLTGIIFMTHRRTGVCLKVSTLRRQFHSLSCIGLSSPCMLSCIAILSEAQNRRSLLWFHPFLLQVRICYTFDHPISLADIFLHFPVMHSSTSTLSFLLLSASYTMQGNLLSISQNGL